MTIKAGYTWDFDNVELKFASNKKLIVDGTFNTEGTTFTASGTSWNGIYFSSTSDGTLDNVDITKVGGSSGNAAVKIYNADPHIEDSFIDVNTGSYVYGIYMSGSYHTATVYRTIIRSQSAPAAYATGTNNYLFLYDTDIIQTTSNPAVHAAGFGGIYFWPGAVSPYVGYDKVKGGRLSATANGVISAGSASNSTSQNHFCNAASSSLEAYGGGTIYARYNYWYNGNTPAINHNNMSGTIYYSNNLGSANCADVPYRVAEAGETPFVLHTADPTQNTPASMEAASAILAAEPWQQQEVSDLRAMLFEAKEKMSTQRYGEAIALLQVVVESGVMPEAHSALLELGAVFRETQDASVKRLSRSGFCRFRPKMPLPNPLVILSVAKRSRGISPFQLILKGEIPHIRSG